MLWGTPRSRSTADLIGALGSLARRGRVFAKETTGRRYPEVLADRQFLAEGARHTFLIRHPRETIASRYALDPGAGLEKFGFESQHEIFTEVRRLGRREPVVIDSGRPPGVAAVQAVARGRGGQHRIRQRASSARRGRRGRPGAERLSPAPLAVLRRTARPAADLECQ